MKLRDLLCAILVASLLLSCSDNTSRSKAVYLLLDTSGSYSQNIDKAQNIIKYLLGTLQPGDSLALARIDSESFSEQDVIAKITFDLRPSRANAQKRTFLQASEALLAEQPGSSTYTDITGGLLQAIEYLNETGAGQKSILLFSDLKEELRQGQIRDFPINFNNIRVVALNVTKLRSDNADPREYNARLEYWERRIVDGGGYWRVMNDLERLDRLLD